jgi:hypothetical protein
MQEVAVAVVVVAVGVVAVVVAVLDCFSDQMLAMVLAHHHQVDMAQVRHQFRGAEEEFPLKRSVMEDLDQIHTRVRGEETHKRLGQCLQALQENFGHKMLK